MTELVSLETLRDLEAGAAYPGYVLEGCETALILFSAAFLGRQDAYWIADAGLRATCVDTDGEKLREMMDLYPADWEFLEADAYTWADPALTPARFDVVSADPWTNEFQRCAAMLPELCGLARKAVVLGVGGDTKVDVPEGWRETERRHRTDYVLGGVWWLVLERG